MKGSLCRLAETSFLWRDTAMRIRERFNPRAPCGARRYLPQGIRYPHKISTHAPLAGRDQEGKQAYGSNEQFQPTRPLRGATDIRLDIRLPQKQFQPTRPLRGATTSFVMSTTISRAISTHAPLAGRDGVVAHIAESPAISTHAPLAGRDAAASSLLPFFFDFNPRAPCGARRRSQLALAVLL